MISLQYICLTFLALLVTSRSQTITPDHAFVANGDNVTLSCSAEATSWLKLVDNSLQAVDGATVGTDLVISNFMGSVHSGKYYCVAMDNDQVTVSCPATLTHARIQATSFQTDPANTTVAINGTAVLSCKPPFSEPPPTIYWKKDGVVLDDSDPRITVLTTGNLYIVSAQLSDAGSYQCIAQNPVTLAKRRSAIASLSISTETVTPTAAHDITVYPSTLRTAVGDVAVIECTASGYPSPVIKWEKHNERVFPANARVLRSGSLVIDPVSEDSTGMYRCIAENDLGRVYSDVLVEVSGPPMISDQPPAVVSLEETSTLTWTVQDNGPVQALLFHDGQLLNIVGSSNEITLYQSLTGADPGVYQVLAQGEYGCTRSTVIVTMPTTMTTSGTTTASEPETTHATPTTELLTTLATTQESSTTPSASTETTTMTTPPATTSTTPTNAEGGSGDVMTTLFPVVSLTVSPDTVYLVDRPVTLVCTVEPWVSTVWWFGPSGNILEGVAESTGDDVLIYTATVTTPGTYTCVVDLGGHLQSANVMVEPAPLIGPPSLVSQEDTPTGGVTIKWAPPVISELLDLVGYRVSLGVMRDPVEVDLKTASFSVDKLIFETNGGSVTVSVWAYSLIAEGERLTVTLTAPQALQIGPPLSVNIERVPSGGVLVTWQPPVTSPGVTLLGYKLNWDREGPIRQVARHSTGVDSRSFHVTPSIFSTYGARVSVAVWAYSLHADGELLTVVVSQVPPAPQIGPPLSVKVENVPSGGVLVTWQPPVTLPGVMLLGYKLNWDREGLIRQVARHSTGVDSRSFHVTLSIFSTYGRRVSVAVWAYSLHADGELLTVVVSQVAPRSCGVGLISPFNATLGFTPDTITSLTYTCTEAQLTQAVNISMATNMVEIQDLLPSCTYIFRVEYEDGEEVSCDLTTPFNEVDIVHEAVRHGNGSVSLRWILPESLRSQSDLIIEVNWGRGWVGVASGDHLPVPMDQHEEYTVQLRFLLVDWVGVVNITVPAVPTDSVPSSLTPSEYGLLYGVIFGGLLVLCAVVLVIILSLKYVQVSRREQDKVSDKKEKEREYFRRMSMERVSMNSIKRPQTTDIKDHSQL